MDEADEKRLKDMRGRVLVNAPAIVIVTKGGSLLHYTLTEATNLYQELKHALDELSSWKKIDKRDP